MFHLLNSPCLERQQCVECYVSSGVWMTACHPKSLRGGPAREHRHGHLFTKVTPCAWLCIFARSQELRRFASLAQTIALWRKHKALRSFVRADGAKRLGEVWRSEQQSPTRITSHVLQATVEAAGHAGHGCRRTQLCAVQLHRSMCSLRLWRLPDPWLLTKCSITQN